MRRGELWTIAGGPDYAGKPRPALIVQEDAFVDTNSVTVCLFTSNPVDAAVLRIRIEPTAENGLTQVSRAMIDKIATVPRERLGKRIGAIANADLVKVDRALMAFLGLAR